MLQKPQITRCYNNTSWNDSPILVLFKKVILKWVGMPYFWEGQVEKWLFSQGLNREFFQVVPDTSENTILHLF